MIGLLKVGVIGTGVMGENHVRVYSNLPNYCRLVGIYDKNEIRARKVAKNYQTTAYQNLEELLKQLDAVTIAVPTNYHYEIGLLCIKHNVHILMEKPITSNSKEAEHLVKEARKKGIIIQVGHIELYNPTIEVLKNIIRNEKIIAVDIHRLSPLSPRIEHANVVQDLMIHDLYILYDLLGDHFKKIYALGKIYDGKIRHAITIAQFTQGVISQLTASFVTEDKVRTIRITTENAFIQADLINRTILISRATNYYLNPIGTNYKQQNLIEKVMVPPKEALTTQLIDFLNCIKTNRKPKVTGEDGIIFLELTEQISSMIMDQNIN